MLLLQIFIFIRKCETYHEIINNKDSLIQNEIYGKVKEKLKATKKEFWVCAQFSVWRRSKLKNIFDVFSLLSSLQPSSGLISGGS